VTQGDRDPPSESVIGRVATILDTIAESPRRIGLSELARRSGVAKSSVHRICSELLVHGLVDRVGDGWTLGPKLFELGQRVPARRRLRDVTMPFLEDLYIDTRRTVHLAALEGDHVVYVEKLAGRDTVVTPSEVAGRMPLHCTATGKCLLAFAGDETSERVLGGPLIAYTPRTITDPAVLRIELEAVRADGVALERDEFADGFSSVAAPIFGLLGTALGALSVTTASTRFNAAALTPLVVSAAAKATARFGGRRPI
jgi:DNA-binding IclR family transcriptional regulator